MKKTRNCLNNQLATVLIQGFEGNDRAQRIQELDFHLVTADACPNPVLAFFTKLAPQPSGTYHHS